jgi:hypothetical protein
VGAHSRNRAIGVSVCELELDVAVEVFEALLAAKFTGVQWRSEKALDQCSDPWF